MEIIDDLERCYFKYSEGDWVWYKGNQRKVRACVNLSGLPHYLLAGDIDTPQDNIYVPEEELTKAEDL
ncbi:MAG: hypothetical protein NC218_01805 [Acetobacter sp.]|nr:hypothetical protein [Acetobacter sp.]